MNVIPATPEDIVRWHGDFLLICPDMAQAIQVLISLGGERLHAIRDGGGFFAKEGQEIVGVVSFSPTGEYGKPNIIGLWAKNHNIQIAAEIIRHAIDALKDSLKVGERIIVDVTNLDEEGAYTPEGLGQDYYDKLEVKQSRITPLFGIK